MMRYVAAATYLALANLIASAFGVMAQPLPGQPDPARGMGLAIRLCSNCHMGNTIRGGAQSADVPTFPEIANRPGQTTERIHGKLIMPRHPMPTIPLTEDEMGDLAAYILSLKSVD